jgi:hypothetical protein
MNRCCVRLSNSPCGLAVAGGLIAPALLLGFVIGCGSSNRSGDVDTGAKESKAKNDSKRRTETHPTAVSANGQKMIDGIPYDVFFDKPLVIAANTQSGEVGNSKSSTVGANASTPTTDSSAATSATPKDPSKETATAGGDGLSLKDLIDKDSLANEVKSLRNYLAGKAASVATYNASYLEIPPEAATLSVLAVAVSRYPEDFSWKKNAKYVRDLAAQIAELTSSDKAKNKNTFDAVAAAFEKIDEILKGSSPAGLPDSPDDKDYGEAISNLVLLMKRIKNSEIILKTSVNNEAALKKEADKVAQEGALLAFMGGIITTPGFGWGGDAEFAKAAQPLREGGKQLVEAAKSGNYPMYDEAMSRIAKSCNECHPKFKP